MVVVFIHNELEELLAANGHCLISIQPQNSQSGNPDKCLSLRISLTLNIFLILLICGLESLYISITDHLDN